MTQGFDGSAQFGFRFYCFRPTSWIKDPAPTVQLLDPMSMSLCVPKYAYEALNDGWDIYMYIPIGSIVVPFCGLYSEPYKAICQKELITKEPVGTLNKKSNHASQNAEARLQTTPRRHEHISQASNSPRGWHGEVHIRPIPLLKIPTSMFSSIPLGKLGGFEVKGV